MRAITSLILLCAVSGVSAEPAQRDGIYFSDACAEGERVTIAAVGDLLFHGHLQRQALAKGATFNGFWERVRPVLSRADVVYGNFEGPAARGVGPGGRDVRTAAKGDDRQYDRNIQAGGEGGVL